MRAFFRALFRLLKGIALFALAYVFLRWFIKNLTGKYWPVFWIWLLLALGVVIGSSQKSESEYDHRTGAEVWQAYHP